MANFNNGDDSDSSSLPPPGKPGDTEDFFVPYYQMTDDNSEKLKTKPKIHTFVPNNSANNNYNTNDDNTHVLQTYNENDIDDDYDDQKLSSNTNNKLQISPNTLGSTKHKSNQSSPNPNNQIKQNHQSQSSTNSTSTNNSIATPIPSSNTSANDNNKHIKSSHSKPTHQYQHPQIYQTTPTKHANQQQPIISNQQQQYQHQQAARTDFSRATKWDIVYLTSSPLVFGNDPYKPLDQLDISGERDGFFNTLKASKQALRVIHKTATTSNIIAAVTGGCRCIHYSGHGYPSYLAFEDAKRIGETHLVHYDLIRKVCEDEDQRIEFVFASACHSEHVGEAFIEAGIQHVVAVNTKFEVTDEAASVFTKHFYNTLLNGRTIEKSFKIAKHAVAAMSSMARLDYDKFLLLPRNGNHAVNIFNNLSPGKLIDDTPQTPINNLPPAVPSFVGRAIDMRHIIHQLMDSGVRLLVLTGNSGIGKSATALMVARYFCDRRMFRGGIFFIDVKKLNNKYKSLSSMLLCVFEECNIIKEHYKKKREKSNNNNNNQSNNKNNKEKEDVFNIIRNMGEMLLVFDGLDQFGDNNKDNLSNNNNNNNNQSNNNDNNNNNNQSHNNNNNSNQSNNNNGNMTEIEIQESIQAFLQNIFEKCSIDTKVLVTSSKKLHMFADFTNCISRYYMLRKLKPKDGAKLFSRLCNQFRHTDIVSNHELMRMLEYNPKQISRVATIKHQYHCDTLEKVVKAYNTKIHLQHSEKKKKSSKKNKINDDKSQKKNKHIINNNDNHSNHHSNHSNHSNNNNNNNNNNNQPHIVDDIHYNSNPYNPYNHPYNSYQRQHTSYNQMNQMNISPMHNQQMNQMHNQAMHSHSQPMHPQMNPMQFAQYNNMNSISINEQNKKKQLLMEKFIPISQARVLWSATSWKPTGEYVAYGDIYDLLSREFKSIFPLTSRYFIQSDALADVFYNPKIGNMNKINNLVSIKYFNNIYLWFDGIIELIRILYEEWNECNPCAIAGFLTREAAINVLKSSQIQSGTFVIRFSLSSFKSIAISYKSLHNQITHVKGKLITNTNKFLFVTTKNNQMSNCQMSLASFIQKFKKLTYLYDVKSYQCKRKQVIYFGKDSSTSSAVTAAADASSVTPSPQHSTHSPYQQQQQQQLTNNNSYNQNQNIQQMNINNNIQYNNYNQKTTYM